MKIIYLFPITIIVCQLERKKWLLKRNLKKVNQHLEHVLLKNQKTKHQQSHQPKEQQKKVVEIHQH